MSAHESCCQHGAMAQHSHCPCCPHTPCKRDCTKFCANCPATTLIAPLAYATAGVYAFRVMPSRSDASPQTRIDSAPMRPPIV
jgi:hypothetical protein